MHARQFLYILLISLVVLGRGESLYAQTVSEDNLKATLEKQKNPQKRFYLILRLGELYKSTDLIKADSLREVLLEESMNLNDTSRITAVLYNAEIARLRGDFDLFTKYVLSSQPFVNKLPSTRTQYEIYKELGRYHSQIHEHETAFFYLNFARNLARKTGEKDKMAEIRGLTAINFMYENAKDSAMQLVEQGLQYARRSSDKSVFAELLNIQSKIYAHFDQYELSVAKNILALQIATEIRDYHLMSLVSREIGMTQRRIKNLDDAEYYFRQSLEYASKINDIRQQGLALTNLGTVAFDRGNYSAAIAYNQRAIGLLEKVNNLSGLGEAHNNLGLVYREQRDFGKATNNFNQSLIFFESQGDRSRIAEVYYNVGTIFYEQNKYANAISYLEKSVDYSIQSRDDNQRHEAYKALSKVYGSTGQTQKSLDYLRRYSAYIDSSNNILAAAKLAELSELYRAEQRDQLISSQADSISRQRQERILAETKLENSQLRNNFQFYIILGLMTIAILGGVLIYSRWNQNKLKQQQREAELSQTLLRTQMNPHFVFNAMSVIQSYIYDNDTANSSKFLVNFSRLMRLILENSPKEEIPIAVEQDILNKYLITQKLRFEDRFEYFIEVEKELESDGAMIPPMITQPFIENSIEHGQLHTIEGGFIRISFKKNGQMLEILIEDNGIGRKASRLSQKSSAHKSMAMQITRDRIDNLNKKYKTEGFLIVEDYDSELEIGTKVLISLPYRTEIPQTND